MSEATNKESSQTQEETQQTQNQQDPPTESNTETEVETPSYSQDFVRSLEQRIAEQQITNRKYEELIKKLAERKEQAPPPPPRDIKAEREAFYADPVGNFNRIYDEREARILDQMRKMIEPLQEVATTLKVTNQYEQLKNSLRQDPIFAKGLNDPDVEAAVDAMMKQPNIEINENSLKSAILQVVGFKMMGGISSSNPNPQNNRPGTVANNRGYNPPVVPSNATRVNRGTTTEQRQLTEDDRTAMRYANLDPNNLDHQKAYWDLIRDDTMVLDIHTKKEAK